MVHLICDGIFGAWIDSLSLPLKIIVSILDAMPVLHNTKSSDVKTFRDLLHAFANNVGDLSSTKVVSFDTDKDLYLKERTRIARTGDVTPVEFDVSASTNISQVRMFVVDSCLMHSVTGT